MVPVRLGAQFVCQFIRERATQNGIPGIVEVGEIALQAKMLSAMHNVRVVHRPTRHVVVELPKQRDRGLIFRQSTFKLRMAHERRVLTASPVRSLLVAVHRPGKRQSRVVVGALPEVGARIRLRV